MTYETMAASSKTGVPENAGTGIVDFQGPYTKEQARVVSGKILDALSSKHSYEDVGNEAHRLLCDGLLKGIANDGERTEFVAEVVEQLLESVERMLHSDTMCIAIGTCILNDSEVLPIGEKSIRLLEFPEISKRMSSDQEFVKFIDGINSTYKAAILPFKEKLVSDAGLHITREDLDLMTFEQVFGKWNEKSDFISDEAKPIFNMLEVPVQSIQEGIASKMRNYIIINYINNEEYGLSKRHAMILNAIEHVIRVFGPETAVSAAFIIKLFPTINQDTKKTVFTEFCKGLVSTDSETAYSSRKTISRHLRSRMWGDWERKDVKFVPGNGGKRRKHLRH
ncbi:MAG: hypothetical protein M1504_03385 [Candidatus Marsarchaeota archaeon]|nr:hypothetical protein [Candidatus Marsarchaeota archaeon]